MVDKNAGAPSTINHQPSTTLAMEGLAMTGAWVDKEKGLLSTIALEMGGSSDLCAHLAKDEPVILMGPTGHPTEIPTGETIMLIGGGLGNAVLFSIGKAMREAGNKVLYFAGYKKAVDRYKIQEIEAAADVVIWACDESLLSKHRPQDHSFHGNIVQAIKWYADLCPPLEGGRASRASREGYQKLADHKYTEKTLLQAKELRKTSTEAERKLWDQLRGKQVSGMKFRRQHTIDSYIADFYCSEARLIIEVDGGQHANSQNSLHDAERTAFLEKKGYRVLRFWNNEVLENMDGVVARITQIVSTPPASAYASAALPQGEGRYSAFINPREADRLIAIGSDRMMAAITGARHAILKPYLKPGHLAIGSINSPMQCMMKEICAQCLQEHIDPETKKVSYVYSCYNQDQPLDCVSFDHLNQRLKQNTVQEKLTAQWIDHCLKFRGLRQNAA